MKLVLLPGMDGTGELFAPLLPHLPAGIEAVVIGHPPDLVLGYAGLTQRVRASLPAGEPFVLLAESFSGPIGIALAATPPPELRGLILSCTYARPPRPGLGLASRLVDAFRLAQPPARPLGWVLYGKYSSRPLREALAASLAQVAPAVLRERLRAVAAIDASDDLRRVALPLLCIRARQDLLVPGVAHRALRALAPSSTSLEFDGPHGLLQARPAVAAQAIADWMRALAG